MRNYELLQNYTISTRCLPNRIIDAGEQGVFVLSPNGAFFSLNIFKIKRYIEGEYIELGEDIDLCYDEVEYYA